MTTQSMRTPCLRQIIRKSPGPLPRSQRRWAQVHNIRFIATHRDPERVFEKYREKLDKKAKEEGLSSVSELKEAYKDKISDFRKKAATIPPTAIPKTSQPPPTPSPSQSTAKSPFPSPPPPPSPTPAQESRTTPGGIKPLSAYLDIPKTLELPPKEIEAIWRLRHAADKTSLCACIPVDIYARIAETARKHPQFIIPLPRPDAAASSSTEQSSSSSSSSTTPADIHFLQWHFPPPSSSSATADPPTTVLFTHLSEYKLRGEYAAPHTTITHHLDLAPSKGIVLLIGNVMSNRGVSVEEGRWLVMCLQRFYGGLGGEGKGRRRRELVEMFGRGDGGFDLGELVEEAARIT